jgi:hypothetical protein
MTISFVIPVLDDAARLTRCLESIAAQDTGELQTIVVDNGSTDGSDRVALRAGATLLRLPGISVAALRNAGARAASGDIVAFVDADHVIVSTWSAAAEAALRDERVAVVGAAYLTEGATWVQRAYDGLRHRADSPRAVSWLGSGNMAMRRTTFLAAKGFDEGLQTCEDVDLCRRLRASGGSVVDDPSLVSVHSGDPATLRNVFYGELWRGRDNLRVSFRRPWSLRGIVTAVLPVALLACLALSLGLAAGGRWSLAAIPAGLFGTLVVVRTLQMCSHQATWGPSTFLQSLPVAVLYEVGRALAVVARAQHRSRRTGELTGPRSDPA